MKSKIKLILFKRKEEKITLNTIRLYAENALNLLNILEKYKNINAIFEII